MNRLPEKRILTSCRKLLVCLLIAVAISEPERAWCVDEKLRGNSVANSPAPKLNVGNPREVTLHIKHGIPLPWEKPGFRVMVGNWTPNGEIFIFAIGPDGERIDLVPKENLAKADNGGEMLVDVDYQRKGLREGHWIFVVAGSLGIHMIETDMPSIEPPTKERNTWKLNFEQSFRRDVPSKKAQ